MTHHDTHPPLPMATKIYPSFGRCIYCLEKFDGAQLTDEHIIPLQLEGTSIIRDACCEPCRKRSNEFEHKAMYNDLLVPRILLGLKRTRRKGNPPQLPPVLLNPPATPEEEEAEKKVILEAHQYPPVLEIIGFPRAGMLAGVERGGSLSTIRIVFKHTGKTPQYLANTMKLRHSHDHTSIALTVLKIAYCHAIGELGIDGFDGDPHRALILGYRDDIYNFVGMEPNQHISGRRHLHHLRLSKSGGFRTVIVYLLGGYGVPAYEVVIGK